MQTAFVTGADRGLGLALVRTLLEKGYKVFAGQFAKESMELAALESSHKGRLMAVMLDVSSDESVREASDYVKSQDDSIDLLINNAGILGDIEKTICEPLDFDEILQVINVNALGELRVINAMVEMVLRSKMKAVVNISSEAGSIGQNHREAWFGYCMSKAALNMGSALVHRNIVKHGGRVLLIHPGWVKSFMRGSLDENAELEPGEAAGKILAVVEEQLKIPVSDLPVFVDSDGRKMQW